MNHPIRVVESIRVMKEKLDYEKLLLNQLPRGPAPPSGEEVPM
ncbi:hypothetical protein H5410_025486 [Solanum commersonii]|uniref:Uncharacterized protein n=1 Tax=Solanum commersonii TaxID=4109 RepID=A0A9J5YUC8_SOLCO|nr:hypothetical protein H5410_025486 [Solanum commersonii]